MANDNGSIEAIVQIDKSATVRITLYALLLIWSFVGNVLVIIVMCFGTTTKSTFNNLIINMSVSDLFISIISIPIKIVEETTASWLVQGNLGNILCKLSYFLSDTSPMVSIFSLLIISIERFILTVYPSWRCKFTAKVNYILIVCTWLAAVILLSPYLYIFRTGLDKNGIAVCYASWLPAFDESIQKYYVLLITTVAFIVPFLSITVFYSLMLYKLHQNNRRVQKNTFGIHRGFAASFQRNKTVFYISISICVAFGFLWAPYVCTSLVLNFSQKTDNASILITISAYLAYSNSAINPCIYFLFLESFRDSLLKIFRRKKTVSSSRLQKRVMETNI